MLWDRCGSTGWNKGTADTIPTSNGDLNLIKDFGQISMKKIKQHVATYINEETRKVQHQYQMYQCIMNSLKVTARLRIIMKSNKYCINNVTCGPLLYKFIMTKASIDTRANLSHIRENLTSLESNMINVIGRCKS